MAGFILNAISPLECFSNMTVMVEIVSQRVEFSCTLSVFALELFCYLRSILLKGFCPPDYRDNLLRSAVL